jgi:putative copper export protein
MDDVIIARALHVLGVVIWIGGVAMVTMVVLPALRRGDLGLIAFRFSRPSSDGSHGMRDARRSSSG